MNFYKRILCYILVFILSINVFACKNVSDANITSEQTTETVFIETIDISDIEDGYTYQRISYPKLTIEGNTALQKSLDVLNENFKKQAVEFKENSKNEIRNLIKDGTFEGALYELIITTNVSRDDEKYLSLNTEIYQFTMGAHGGHYYEGDNFDKITGEKLKLTDFISDKNDLKNQILNWCDKNKEEIFLFDEYKETVDRMINEEKPEFIIKNKSIQVIFQEYDIAPYAYGPSFIDIKI